MIKVIDNILLDSEIDIVNKICENFQYHEKPNSVNYYNRMHFSEDYIKNSLEKIKKIIEEEEEKKYMLLPNGSSFINKINNTTNQNDKFHYDNSETTAIIYLNENFIGGDFEYLDEEGHKTKIKPKKNLGLIINNKLKHRVLPVTKGDRFSLICFFVEEFSKTKKTLL